MHTHKSFVLLFLILLFSSLVFSTSLASNAKNISQTGAKVNIVADRADNVSAAGARVSVTGSVSRDIWLAGAAVEADVQSGGDLYAAGADVQIMGKIQGAVAVAGAEVLIDATIEQELDSVGASITFSESSSVGNNSSAAAAVIEFNGEAKEALELYADEIIFNGRSNGTVHLEGRNVHVTDNAMITGDLYIHSVEKPIISSFASIDGDVKYKEFTEEEYNRIKDPEDTLFANYGGKLIIGASAFLLGLLLIFFTGNTTNQITGLLKAHPVHSILWGLGILFGLPLLVFFCLVSVIGIPIGLTSLLLIPFLILLGFTAAILSLADYLLSKSGQEKNKKHQVAFLALSILIYYLIRLIPVFGAIVVFVAMLFGLGAAVVTIGNRIKGDQSGNQLTNEPAMPGL